MLCVLWIKSEIAKKFNVSYIFTCEYITPLVMPWSNVYFRTSWSLACHYLIYRASFSFVPDRYSLVSRLLPLVQYKTRKQNLSERNSLIGVLEQQQKTCFLFTNAVHPVRNRAITSFYSFPFFLVFSNVIVSLISADNETIAYKNI